MKIITHQRELDTYVEHIYNINVGNWLHNYHFSATKCFTHVKDGDPQAL